MDPNTFPTKGNLILAKNSLALSRQGFELMDKKRNIKTRSVMGTEIPLVEYDKQLTNTPTYAYYSTRVSLDQAKAAFEKVKELSIQLAGIENAAIRLAANIKKTQKRANALKNITIPRYEALTKDIQNALEEKEREEFTRLKVIKRMKQKG